MDKKLTIFLGVFLFIIALIVVVFFAISQNNICFGPLCHNNSTIEKVSFLFSGTLTNNKGLPVSGVEVTTNVNASAVLSNAFGEYVLENEFNLKESSPLLTLTFSKKGFVPLHKIINLADYDSEKETVLIDAVMVEENPFEEVNVLEETNIRIQGSALNAEKESFVLKGTEIKASSAKISLTPFDPTSEIGLETFPGEFEGVQLDGSITAIESFGFVKVQVRDTNDNELDLAEGKTAELVVPISLNQINSSPDVIPLWYFDPALGTWVERGVAQKYCENNSCYYKGKIDTIASWWNCDVGISNSGQVNPTSKINADLGKCISDPTSCAKDADCGASEKSAFTKAFNTPQKISFLEEALSNFDSSTAKNAEDFFSDEDIATILSALDESVPETCPVSAEEESNAVGEKEEELSEEEQRALDMVNEAREKLGLPPLAKGEFWEIPYDKEVNTFDDLIELTQHLEGLFPDASRAEIIRLMRASSRYGPRGDRDIGGELYKDRAGYEYIFGGGELHNIAGLPLNFQGILKSNSEILVNGSSVDLVHMLIGADVYYERSLLSEAGLAAAKLTADNWNKSLLRFGLLVSGIFGTNELSAPSLPTTFFQGSMRQMWTDIADAGHSEPEWGLGRALTHYSSGQIGVDGIMRESISDANPPDLRGNILGAQIGNMRNDSFSESLINARDNIQNWLLEVDYYEQQVYSPLRSGASAESVMPAAQYLANYRPYYSNLPGVINTINQKVQELKSKNNTASNSLTNSSLSKAFFGEENPFYSERSYGVDVRTGALNINLIPGFVSYSQSTNYSPNKSAFPFSVFNAYILEKEGVNYFVTQEGMLELTSSGEIKYSLKGSNSTISTNDAYLEFGEEIDSKRMVDGFKSGEDVTAYIYEEEKLAYVGQDNNKAIFFLYDNNLLSEMFFTYGGHYFSKYAFVYKNKRLTNVNYSTPYEGLSEGSKISVDYFADGKIKEFSINGISRRFEYDSNNRVISQTIVLENEGTYNINYFYVGNETIVVEQADGFSELSSITKYTLSQNGVYKEIIKEQIGNDLSYSLDQKDLSTKSIIVSRGEVELEGVDYSSKQKETVSISSNGIVTLKNTSRGVFGKPLGKAKVNLSFDNVFSEQIDLTLPQAGQTIELALEYGGLLVPLKLKDSNNTANLLIEFIGNNDKNISAKSYLSSNKQKDTLMFLVSPYNSGKVIITELFTGIKNTYNIPSVAPNSVVLINSKPILGINFNSAFKSKFDCNSHYAFIKRIRADEDNNFTTTVNGEYEDLYYDGILIDSSSSIGQVRLFEDNIAYEKQMFYDKNDTYCGDYYYSNYSSKPAITCTSRKTHIIHNGVDLGVGENIELWGEHIAYERAYPEDGFIYDENVYGEDCNHVTFELWGNNFAYECKDNSFNSLGVYWNNKKIGEGSLEGMHKDFLLVRDISSKTNSSSNETKYTLFKSGEEVYSYSKKDLTEIGVFGNNWIEVKNYSETNSVRYNGKTVFDSPKNNLDAVIFENNLFYGDSKEAYFNGQKVESDSPSYRKTKLSNSAFSFPLNDGVLYNGQIYANGNWFDEVYLFENNWLGLTRKRELFFNEAFVGKDVYSQPVLFGDNYAYSGKEIPEEEFNHTLIYNGNNIGKVSLGDFVLFGDHIAYGNYNYSLGSESSSSKNSEVFVDKNSIGFLYFNEQQNEVIESFVAWPVMNSSNELGTFSSNTKNITSPYNETYTNDGFRTGLGYGLSASEISFDSTWLYCTDQWK